MSSGFVNFSDGAFFSGGGVFVGISNIHLPSLYHLPLPRWTSLQLWQERGTVLQRYLVPSLFPNLMLLT